jgi:hypothetical protein
MTEEISKQVARENFAISTVPMLEAASFEPLLHQSRDEEEEGLVGFEFRYWNNDIFLRTY